ncbi:hypothetical protein DFS34DRAFT_648206 [Phlyctochytrium arcticum]|nr:hypothetical protein DFS34DRAFT_648206 [Phlyctochytrium arcticum]
MMEAAPPLPPRPQKQKQKRPVPLPPKAQQCSSAEDAVHSVSPAHMESSLTYQNRQSASDLNGKQSSSRTVDGPPKPERRRRTEDVEKLIQNAPSVPNILLPVHMRHEDSDDDDEENVTTSVAGPSTATMVGQSSEISDRRAAEAYAYIEESLSVEAPPAYTSLYKSSAVHYPDVKGGESPITVVEAITIPPAPISTMMEPSAPSTPTIDVSPSAPTWTLARKYSVGESREAPATVGSDQHVDDKLLATTSAMPAPHRRCYSDVSSSAHGTLDRLEPSEGVTTAQPSPEPASVPLSEENGRADDTKTRLHHHLRIPGTKNWRHLFASSRGTASDVGLSNCNTSDEDESDDGLVSRTERPDPGSQIAFSTSPGSPTPPPGDGDGNLPSAAGLDYSLPIAYPTTSSDPIANPLHPTPTPCEIREEWEPGMDPSFASKSKISHLFAKGGGALLSPGGAGETAWKRGWIELVQEDGWKIGVWECVKMKGRNGEIIYMKKPNTLPYATYSLRHADVTRPRTGYGPSKPDILCTRLVSGKYFVLSLPSPRLQKEWTRGVKAAAEMSSRVKGVRGK